METRFCRRIPTFFSSYSDIDNLITFLKRNAAVFRWRPLTNCSDGTKSNLRIIPNAIVVLVTVASLTQRRYCLSLYAVIHLPVELPFARTIAYLIHRACIIDATVQYRVADVLRVTDILKRIVFQNDQVG